MNNDDSGYRKDLRAYYVFDVGTGLGVNGSSEKYFIPRLVKVMDVHFRPMDMPVYLGVWVITPKLYQRLKKQNHGCDIAPQVCFKRTKDGFHMFYFPLPLFLRWVCVAGEFDEQR